MWEQWGSVELGREAGTASGTELEECRNAERECGEQVWLDRWKKMTGGEMFS